MTREPRHNRPICAAVATEAVRAAAIRGVSRQEGFLLVGHGNTPPNVPTFGPALFDKGYQASHPDAPATRLVKDVLRTGSWVVGFNSDGTERRWDVTEDFIRKVCQANRLAQSRGQAVNLVKTHGDPFTGVVHPDDIICPIHDWRAHEDALWIECYVTPDVAKQLSNPAMKVSVYCQPGYVDGAGHRYDALMLHVAVVDLPVVNSQGPFIQLSQTPIKAAATQPTKGKAMDFATLIEAVNGLLTAFGENPLPDDTDETNVVDRLKMVVAILSGGSEEPAEETEGTEPPVLEGENLETLAASQQAVAASQQGAAAAGALNASIAAAVTAALAPLNAKLAPVFAFVEKAKTDRTTEAVRSGEAILASAGTRGVAPATIEAYRAAWKAAGHNPEILRPLDAVAASVPMGRVAGRVAPKNTSGKPVGALAKPDAIAASRKTGVKSLGGNPDRVPAHLRGIVFGEETA